VEILCKDDMLLHIFNYSSKNTSLRDNTDYTSTVTFNEAV